MESGKRGMAPLNERKFRSGRSKAKDAAERNEVCVAKTRLVFAQFPSSGFLASLTHSAFFQAICSKFARPATHRMQTTVSRRSY